MSEIKRESPLVGQKTALHGASHSDAGVRLRERPFLGHISVRGRSDDAAFLEAGEAVLGVKLPTRPNTQAEGNDLVVGWMGPTEWLVITEEQACRPLLEKLNQAFADVHAAAVELSGGQTVIEIRGEHAMDVLAKGTTFDLHPRNFGAGQCTRTHLAHSTVFVRVIEPGKAFSIVIRRSFADHLWRWLSDAALEYGCHVDTPEVRPALTGDQ